MDKPTNASKNVKGMVPKLVLQRKYKHELGKYGKYFDVVELIVHSIFIVLNTIGIVFSISGYFQGIFQSFLFTFSIGFASAIGLLTIAIVTSEHLSNQSKILVIFSFLDFEKNHQLVRSILTVVLSIFHIISLSVALDTKTIVKQPSQSTQPGLAHANAIAVALLTLNCIIVTLYTSFCVKFYLMTILRKKTRNQKTTIVVTK